MRDETQFLLFLLFFSFGVYLLAGAYCDLDWQFNVYYWNMTINGVNGVWFFSPHWSMNWWWAYQTSVLRLIIGAGFLGAFFALLGAKFFGKL